MSGRDWLVALNLCRRELRGGLRGFGVFLGCLFLGVLAISAVGSLGRALEAGLAGDAKAILGGDVSVSLTSRDLSPDEAAYLRGFGDLARVTVIGIDEVGRRRRPQLRQVTDHVVATASQLGDPLLSHTANPVISLRRQ